jgi:RNA polymerase sigma-70 factor (ECF subfamily)
LIVDKQSFEELVKTHREELHVHCYRMLGSVLDAEDLVQETLLRAWRARTTFHAQASPRTWLYRIATNVCLTALARRARRVLPEDVSAPTQEVAWLEPYPDRLLEAVADAEPGPEALCDQREATELAFVAALQHLPPRQRAVLFMRDVIGLSVAEVAEQLDSSREAVSSAHQRTRVTLQQRLDRETPLSLTGGQRRMLERYVAARETNDLNMFVGLLAEDVVLSMPPMPEWLPGGQPCTGSSPGRGDPRGRARSACCRHAPTPNRPSGCTAEHWTVTATRHHRRSRFLLEIGQTAVLQLHNAADVAG